MSGIQVPFTVVHASHNKLLLVSFYVVTVFYFGFSFSEPNNIILVSALVTYDQKVFILKMNNLNFGFSKQS